MPKRNDLEQKALQFVMNTGFEGVLQAELWRELGASSREGSRISIKLEDKGLIRREKELREGRWTYRLFPKRLPASINTIADCPCLIAQTLLDVTQLVLSRHKHVKDLLNGFSSFPRTHLVEWVTASRAQSMDAGQETRLLLQEGKRGKIPIQSILQTGPS